MTIKLEEWRGKVRDDVAAALGESYDCIRVWSAWGYGTMGPDDFVLVAEDDDRLSEIIDAAITPLLTELERLEQHVRELDGSTSEYSWPELKRELSRQKDRITSLERERDEAANDMKQALHAATLAERENCAKVAEDSACTPDEYDSPEEYARNRKAQLIAAAIRSRK